MRVGIDLLRCGRSGLFKGARVGLVSHQAATCSDGASSAQALHDLLGERLVALFGPEHGFFGGAGPGERTETRIHPDWGIPVYSLYGESRKPTPGMLGGIDLLIVDLQDLGIRCYTYFATLKLLLEACSEAGIRVIVADRPSPCGGVVDGASADPAWFSFVAPCALPMVYGMTQGESSLWLKKRLDLDLALEVVPMEGWRRESLWGETFPPFVPPSPGIRTWEAARLYPATVFTEALPVIDCGRATPMAFRVLGAPFFRAEDLCGRVREVGLPGLSLHPYRFTPEAGRYAGMDLDGIRFTPGGDGDYRPVTASLILLREIQNLYGPSRLWEDKETRSLWFDKLYGSDRVRLALRKGEIRSGDEGERQTFMREREDVLLY